jgi:hypothetical protein
VATAQGPVLMWKDLLKGKRGEMETGTPGQVTVTCCNSLWPFPVVTTYEELRSNLSLGTRTCESPSSVPRVPCCWLRQAQVSFPQDSALSGKRRIWCHSPVAASASGARADAHVENQRHPLRPGCRKEPWMVLGEVLAGCLRAELL